MGVKACDRKDCKNIMCDRLSHEYGYICTACFTELSATPHDIATFMDNPKDHHHNLLDNGWEELVALEFSDGN